MANFTFNKTKIDGVYIIDVKSYGDARGYFMETYNENEFKSAGLNYTFVQDNQSASRKGVLRGLHFQKTHPQAKLVRAIKGAVFDVAVDLRAGSETYGEWVGALLTEGNHRQIMVPRGFAHGFYVLSESAEFAYKCDDFYHPEDEGGIMWNDQTVGVDWGIGPDDEILLSEKDKHHPTLAESGMKFYI